ncbi:uncharacterized protein THITE_2108085 [Thermothielavioides terrestris NRRL 8126]|uniref:Uncharacterized protein n=1 Tax=Thermothielavioides terrestris (strain ATCC 38088 / NRRL 8126) TaxID=578455 RepID=G2QXF6_THETT|nr:uncharacterized protein THITE_2108085 [Thermothielavioides terrestris NRRL 8126]AEO63179.1 hypothetical protein THITE_2108085 [Thermothielavioides terrestris NRRL 8126]
MGRRLITGGTQGFFDPEDPDRIRSHKRHDDYSLERVREWWDSKHAEDESVEDGPVEDKS